jgi:ribosomal protein L7/L12
MVFDVKLKGFDAAAKLKIIKELRTFTNLGRVSARNSLAAAAATNGGMTEHILQSLSLSRSWRR